MAVTVDDIAEQAGVSSATISGVLNNSSYVKDETKEKVLKVIGEVNYVPGAMARSPSRRETDTIGIIVPGIANSYFGEIIKGISKVIEGVGLNIILFNTNNDVKGEMRALDEVRKHRLKGVIVTPGFGDTEFQDIFTDMVNSINILIILVSVDLNYMDSNRVFVDDIRGGCDATNLLINEGHNKIRIITGIISSGSTVNRPNGYKKALIEDNASIMDHYIKEGEFNLDRAYEIAKEFLDMANPSTAMISCNSRMTLSVIKTLFEGRKKIPKNITLVGFNKIDLVDIVGISLTYIEDPPIELGQSSTRLPLEIFESNEKSKIRRIKIPPKIISNGSEDKVGQ